MEIDESAAEKLVMELLAIPGRSCHEQQVSERIQERLIAWGVPASAISTDTAHRRSPAGGEIGNLIVKLKGTVRGPRRLLMAHMDTVPLAVGCQPVRDGEWIVPKSPKTALGGDNRAGCAAVLTAVRELLHQQRPHPSLTILLTVQEEIGLRGSRFLTHSKLGKPQACFNWDGRDPGHLVNGAVGATNMQISIDGIASHAGVHPEQGVNAAVVASLAIADLQAEGWHGLVEKGRQRGASNIGTIRGGAATNVVMPDLMIEAEARSHSPAFRKRIVKAYCKAFERASKAVQTSSSQTATVSFDEDTRYEPFSIPRTDPCVTAAVAAARHFGYTPLVAACDGGLDANWLTEHGFPTVTLGCGQHNIHTVDERLHVPMFLDACRMATWIASASSEE